MKNQAHLRRRIKMLRRFSCQCKFYKFGSLGCRKGMTATTGMTSSAQALKRAGINIAVIEIKSERLHHCLCNLASTGNIDMNDEKKLTQSALWVCLGQCCTWNPPIYARPHSHRPGSSSPVVCPALKSEHLLSFADKAFFERHIVIKATDLVQLSAVQCSIKMGRLASE